MEHWRSDATAIGRTATLTALGFAAVAAVGVLIQVVDGPAWLAIAFAAIGTVGALVALVVGVMQVKAEHREVRDALWRERPRSVAQTLAGDGMYAVGVETEAPEALEAAGLGPRAHAP